MPYRPKIAIVIDDMGLSWDAFEAVNALEGPLTMAFLPYGREAQAMMNQIDKAHDAMLHLPMEPLEKIADAGPDMLRAGDDRDAVRKTLLANLGKVQGYSGVNNHTGSRFTADRPGMEIVLEELHRRGLFFLDSVTTERPVAHRIAQAEGYRVIERNVFLDHNFPAVSIESVSSQLKALERVARVDGQAIAIGHPYRATIDALEEWMISAELRGFELVLVRDLTVPQDAQTTLVELR